MTKEEIACNSFDNGYNCAQSVLLAFKNELDIDEKDLIKISSGFGGGMGRLQHTCGAVTGAFMAISLKFGSTDQHEKEANELTISKIQEFEKRFNYLNKTSNCGELLKCDLKTDEGQAYFTNENLNEKVCKKAISDSVIILKDLL